jgi:diguanylate cyclase (GGDEF)-like protein/PAS domain S-box-containing protein
MKPFEQDKNWQQRRDQIIGLGERSFRKSYYPQLRQNLARLERFRTLLDHTSDFVLLLTLPEGDIVDANKALARLLNCSIDDLIGQPFSSLGISEGATVFKTLIQETMVKTAEADPPTHTVVLPFGQGEETIWIELTYSIARVAYHSYGILVGRNITERRRAESKALFLAYHDQLTGLPNRTLFQDRLHQAAGTANREKTKIGLIAIDLDRFKTINDSLGHSVGDQLLIEVAKRMKRSLRNTDTVCRLSGDEFLLLLPNMAEPDSCIAVLAKLNDGLNAPYHIDGIELGITASAGIAVYPDDGIDLETLLKNADTALYRAKEASRNTYRFFNQEMNEEAVERLAMHSDLMHALDHEQFELYYQPQIEINSGALIGVEALLRWRHPSAGLIPPGRFISLAEENGLIVPIGKWVLHEACRTAAEWQQRGLPAMSIAVNLSALQFKRGDIEATVAQVLERSGLDPALLELELTETILIQETDKVLATVTRLKHMGIRLSIDDFGTGYSSLAYLKRFKVDKLKIDRSFIRNLANDPENAAIVRAIVNLANSLGLRTVAEGVEDECTLHRLRYYHCDEVQGYLISHPLPAEEFTTKYQQIEAGGPCGK